jgi:hypothetical protein
VEQLLTMNGYHNQHKTVVSQLPMEQEAAYQVERQLLRMHGKTPLPTPILTVLQIRGTHLSVKALQLNALQVQALSPSASTNMFRLTAAGRAQAAITEVTPIRNETPNPIHLPTTTDHVQDRNTLRQNTGIRNLRGTPRTTAA